MFVQAPQRAVTCLLESLIWIRVQARCDSSHAQTRKKNFVFMQHSDWRFVTAVKRVCVESNLRRSDRANSREKPLLRFRCGPWRQIIAQRGFGQAGILAEQAP